MRADWHKKITEDFVFKMNEKDFGDHSYQMEGEDVVRLSQMLDKFVEMAREIVADPDNEHTPAYGAATSILAEYEKGEV